jgi:hypothetical protein
MVVYLGIRFSGKASHISLSASKHTMPYHTIQSAILDSV